MTTRFTVALGETVSESLGEPVIVVSDVSFSANRRKLLTGVRVSYIVTITSTKSTEFFMDALQESVSSGSFASVLSVKLGYLISRTSVLAVYNLSPPASSLKFTSKSGEELLTDKDDKEYANMTVSSHIG